MILDYNQNTLRLQICAVLNIVIPLQPYYDKKKSKVFGLAVWARVSIFGATMHTQYTLNIS